MKIVVTGGAGFIGSHLVDELIKNGDEVLVLDDLSAGKEEHINQAAKFIKHDIRSNDIINIIKDFEPQVIFHLAAQKSVRSSLLKPGYDAEINIIGSLNVFEAAKKVKAKVVYTSTAGIYGDNQDLPLKEESDISPMSPYVLSKYTAESYLHFYYSKFVSYVSLRLANVYGPRQDSEGEAGVVSIFFTKLVSQQTPTIFGDGLQTRDFVYVTDIVRALTLAMKSKMTGIYNIGTSKRITINELFDKQAKIADFSKSVEYADAVPGEIRHNSLDYAKAKKSLSWKPAIDLDKGLKITFEWFQ